VDRIRKASGRIKFEEFVGLSKVSMKIYVLEVPASSCSEELT
jgi:hypothetical protein